MKIWQGSDGTPLATIGDTRVSILVPPEKRSAGRCMMDAKWIRALPKEHRGCAYSFDQDVLQERIDLALARHGLKLHA